MARLIRPSTKLDDFEVERIRQRLDELGMATPNYGAPLSAKYRSLARRRARIFRARARVG